MFIEQYRNWCKEDARKRYEAGDEQYDKFSCFYQENSVGKTFMEMLCEQAWQIWQLQVCVEGLLEDLNDGS
jgi:hypothetical protein